jgi:hypothetical protein
MVSSKINHGVQMSKRADRHDGVIHVMRGHRPLGVMDRVKPEVGVRHAFEAYQKLESGEAARQIRADALRMMMLAGA